jgi:hypothetical protein
MQIHEGAKASAEAGRYNTFFLKKEPVLRKEQKRCPLLWCKSMKGLRQAPRGALYKYPKKKKCICIATMKMHDTGYKIHEGVNTISGVCESADTKQNIS